MKFAGFAPAGLPGLSRPSRGAWVEIVYDGKPSLTVDVAPLAGRVG